MKRPYVLPRLLAGGFSPDGFFSEFEGQLMDELVQVYAAGMMSGFVTSLINRLQDQVDPGDSAETLCLRAQELVLKTLDDPAQREAVALQIRSGLLGERPSVVMLPVVNP